MPIQRAKGGHLNNGDGEAGIVENTNSRVIRALQASKNNKLASINLLLQGVVRSACTVVKGTDSQRRFNAQFSEFCRAALVGIAELEDAVYELEKTEGLTGNDENGVQCIGVADFVKEMATFIASQTNALGVQYLEHVGMSALSTAAKPQQKPTETKRGAKRGRVEDTKQWASDRRSPQRKRTGTSPPLGPNWELDAPPPLHNSGSCRGGRGAHHGAAKLTSIPTLSTWLQPWTLPLPNAHGIVLDRVTTERPKQSSGTAEEPTRLHDEVSVFDICTAPTPAEVLRLWEARESLLSPGVDRGSSLGAVACATVPPHAKEEGKPMFFPKSDLGLRASVPTHVLVDLVHCGISSLEMPFKDMV
ncbi:hypothetical protein DQ04_00581180 [Trypanosoma grayi]|uniref:hypothetical protein n=1 Tax=Trypanosoma grayi TaxID=71804 RepID=UPI0004F41185|nr:hypothetical protein DQ04_00581180 [Trypanosoma grayi]KEG14200.1 hypothetical protein DQ04_00581180 [Trypanosoma grayi]